MSAVEQLPLDGVPMGEPSGASRPAGSAETALGSRVPTTPAPTPAPSAARVAPADRLSVAAGVTVLEQVLNRIDTSLLAEADAGVLVGRVSKVRTRVDALHLAVLAVADRAKVAGFSGASGTGAWLADLTKSDERVAVADAKLATSLGDGQAPATREALAAGRVSKDHAAIIVTALADLPADLTPAERARAERSLVAKAGRMSPGKLRREARRAVEDAGRTKDQADRHEGVLLRSLEDKAWDKCRFSLHDNTDGTATGSFTVPTFAADVLRKALQQMTAPRRTRPDSFGSTETAGTPAGLAGPAEPGNSSAELSSGRTQVPGVGHLDPSTGAPTTSVGGVGGAHPRSFQSRLAAATGDWDWAHRQGVALAELLEHLPTDRLSGKVAATVVVTVDHDKLREQIGAARSDTGHDLSAAQARRIACNAGILPAVLGGQSQVLDLGRTSRFFSEVQRTALATRYEECAAEGCDRPYAWSELHHQDPWRTGGRTDLDLAIPLCGYHHRRIHDPNYNTTTSKGSSGRKTVTYTRRT